MLYATECIAEIFLFQRNISGASAWVKGQSTLFEIIKISRYYFVYSRILLEDDMKLAAFRRCNFDCSFNSDIERTSTKKPPIFVLLQISSGYITGPVNNTTHSNNRHSAKRISPL